MVRSYMFAFLFFVFFLLMSVHFTTVSSATLAAAENPLPEQVAFRILQALMSCLVSPTQPHLELWISEAARIVADLGLFFVYRFFFFLFVYLLTMIHAVPGSRQSSGYRETCVDGLLPARS